MKQLHVLSLLSLFIFVNTSFCSEGDLVLFASKDFDLSLEDYSKLEPWGDDIDLQSLDRIKHYSTLFSIGSEIGSEYNRNNGKEYIPDKVGGTFTFCNDGSFQSMISGMKIAFKINNRLFYNKNPWMFAYLKTGSTIEDVNMEILYKIGVKLLPEISGNTFIINASEHN